MPVCPIHNVDTLLRCGKCDKPICPDCMVVGPAGVRCAECASIRSSPLFHVAPNRLLLGAALGLLAATLGGYVMAAAYAWGFVIFWLGFIDGIVVGEVILRCISRKRGRAVEATAVACTVVGFLAGVSVYFLQFGFTPTPPAIWGFWMRRYFEPVGLAMAVFGALGRARFF